MPSVTLSDQEWQALVNVLANASAPWVVTNPLLSKISAQLQREIRGNAQETDEADRMPPHMNG